MSPITPPALAHLHTRRDETVAKKEETNSCTLAYWRFKQPDVLQALEEFAKSQDWNRETADKEACIREVQDLFTKMNKGMVQQEKESLWRDDQGPSPCAKQWSVVFGGKWAERPCSIAEQLVDLLWNAGKEARVYTVSRSTQINWEAQPDNVKHFPKLNLEEAKVGKGEFEDVLNKVFDDYDAAFASNGQEDKEKVPIVLYFTLAKHKGNNLPFQRNIQSANNFVQALESVVPSRLVAKNIPWKVVVTGTDATCPSTQQDKDLGMVEGVATTAPTYRVLPHNTVYAASKLCQFYSIAASVAKMTQTDVKPLASSREGHDGSLTAIDKQLQNFVFSAGANGAFQENDYLDAKELDEVSLYWTDVAEPSLKKHLQTAKGISICYTPLHRDPWTEMGLDKTKTDSPKKIVIDNVMWRLRNGISIDRAARAHL
ncbi:expressed unknown protein [Seminavis robusta]|uniref:Uncharacterized protein n=1 Tax=Seminavis robusta TaxID=568900 RepID=A0A9N8DNK3_9STRA|nr:expressed unknown protein [Seminavis robusta]|eukprot:Sro261_g101800.1 n/a (429) ;mRNA; f:56650-57936